MRTQKPRARDAKKERYELRKLNKESQAKFTTVVVPTLITVAVFIVLYVYSKTRPQY